LGSRAARAPCGKLGVAEALRFGFEPFPAGALGGGLRADVAPKAAHRPLVGEVALVAPAVAIGARQVPNELKEQGGRGGSEVGGNGTEAGTLGGTQAEIHRGRGKAAVMGSKRP